MDEAWKGVGVFEGQKPFKEMRVVEKVTDQACSVAVLAKSPIKSFMDFSGKKVNLGPAGTGLVFIFRSMFKALDLTDKVKVSYLNHEGAAQALKDGQIDPCREPRGTLYLSSRPGGFSLRADPGCRTHDKRKRKRSNPYCLI